MKSQMTIETPSRVPQIMRENVLPGQMQLDLCVPEIPCSDRSVMCAIDPVVYNILNRIASSPNEAILKLLAGNVSWNR